MMETLADDERIRVSLPAKVVRSTVESSGEVLLGDVKFYFFGDNTRSTQVPAFQIQSENSLPAHFDPAILICGAGRKFWACGDMISNTVI